MFEWLVSDILLRFVGDYVRHLNADQLRLDVLSGLVVLKDLELKADALAKFSDLPVFVKQGYLKSLELKLPWKSLGSQPVEIKIDGVYLVVERVKATTTTSPQFDLESLHSLKMKRLAAYEEARSKRTNKPSVEPSKQSGSTFGQRILAKVLANLQITLTNIHVRYEDTNERGESFAIGVAIRAVRAESTNSNWEPCFINTDTQLDLIFNMVTIDSFSVYWDTGCTHIDSDINLFSEQMTALIPPCSYPHSFILEPISGKMKLTVNNAQSVSTTAPTPKYTASINFDNISIELHHQQYVNGLELANTFHAQRKAFIKQRKGRPSVEVHGNAKLWWKYVLNRVTEDVRKHKTFNWRFLSHRKELRLKYVALYTKIMDSQATAEDKLALDALDRELSFEDIIFFRSLATIQLKPKPTPEPTAAPQPQPTAVQQRGWVSWLTMGMWGAPQVQTTPHLSSTTTAPTPTAATPQRILNAEQRLELLEIFGYDAVKHDFMQDGAPPMHIRIFFELGALHIDLRGKTNTKVAEFCVQRTTVQWNSTPSHFDVKATVGGISVDDLQAANRGELFPRVVSVRQLPPTACPTREITGLPDQTSPQAMFEFSLENRPPESDADYVLSMRLLPLEVIVSPSTIHRVCSFFYVPKNVHIDTVTGGVNEWLSQKTTVNWREALENHIKVDMDVDLHAPVLIIPQNNTAGTPLLILDLGRLRIKSELGSKSEPLEHLETTAYDHYNLQASDIHTLLMYSSDGDWRNQVSANAFPLIPPFAINLRLSQFVLDTNETHYKLKAAGSIPDLHVKLSGEIVQIVKNILESSAAAATVTDLTESQMNFLDVKSLVLTEDQVPIIAIDDREEMDSKQMDVSSIDLDLVQRLSQNRNRKLLHASFSVQNLVVHLVTSAQASPKGLIDIECGGAIATQKLLFVKRYTLICSTEKLVSINILINEGSVPQVQVAANNVKVQANLATVAELMRFFDVGVSAPQHNPTPTQREGSKLLNLTLELKQLTLILNSNNGVDSKAMAHAFVVGVTSVVEIRKRTLSVRGGMNGITLCDLTAADFATSIDPTPTRSHYSTVLYSNECGGEIVNFTLNVYSAVERTYPGFDTLLLIRTKGIHLVFTYRFVSLLLSYVSDFQEMRSLLIQQLHNMLPAPDSKFKLDISMQNTKIVMPKNSAAPISCVADVNQFSVSNTFNDGVEDMLVEVDKMQLSQCVTKTNCVELQPCSCNLPPLETVGVIASDVTMKTHYKRPFSMFHGVLPEMDLSFEFPEVSLVLTESQYHLIVGILFENMDETPYPIVNTGQIQRSTSPSPAVPTSSDTIPLTPWRVISIAVPKFEVSTVHNDAVSKFCTLCFDDFTFKQVQKGSVLHIGITVRGMVCRDFMQTGGPDANILLAHEQVPGDMTNALIKFDYEKNVKELATSQSFVIIFNRLYGSFNEGTILALQKFFTPPPTSPKEVQPIDTTPTPTQNIKTADQYKMSVSIQHLTFGLMLQSQKFGVLSVENGQMDMFVDSSQEKTEYSGCLGSVTLTNVESGKDALRFAQGGDGLVRFRVALSKQESAVHVQMHQALILVEPLFINKLIEHSSQLTQTTAYAKTKAEKAIETVIAPPLLSVDATLDGPTLVLPDSGGTNCLVWNMGTFIVKSGIEQLPQGGKNVPCSVYRVSVRESCAFANMNEAAPRCLVDKVGFDLQYSESGPNIGLALHVTPIVVSLHRSEYQMALSVANNIATVGSKRTDAPLQRETALNGSNQTEKETTQPERPSTPSIKLHRRQTEEEKVYKIVLKLDQMKLQLENVANCMLTSILLEASIQEIGISMHLQLDSIQLNELLPNSTSKFKKIIKNRKKAPTQLSPIPTAASFSLYSADSKFMDLDSDITPLLVADYEQIKGTSPDFPQHKIVLVLSNPGGCLAPNVIMTVLNFFSSDQTPAAVHDNLGQGTTIPLSPASSNGPTDGALPNASAPQRSLLRQSSSLALKTNTDESKSKWSNILNALDLTLRITHPEFLAIEDRSSASSQAIALRLQGIHFRLKTSNDSLDAKVELHKFRVFSCRCDQRKQRHIILNPCMLDCSFQRNGNELAFNLKASEWSASVSYNDLRVTLLVVLQFLGAMSDSNSALTSPTQAPPTTSIVSSALATAHTIRPLHHTTATPVASSELAISPPLSSLLGNRHLTAHVSIPFLTLVLVNDRNWQSLPVIEVVASSILLESNDNCKVNSLQLTLKGNYFNELISMWEPLIEPFSLSTSLTYTPPHPQLTVSGTPTSSITSVSSAPTVTTSSAATSSPSAPTSSPAPSIEITITAALVSSLLSVYQTWMNDYKMLMQNPNVSARVEFKPYRIENETGLTVKLAVRNVIAELSPGKVADLKLSREETQSVVMMKFHPEQSIETPVFPVNKIQTVAFSVSPFARTVLPPGSISTSKRLASKFGSKATPQTVSRALLVNISLENGAKVISLQSRVQFVNSCAFALEVFFQTPPATPLLPPSNLCMSVAQGKPLFFPLLFTDESCGRSICAFRPDGFECHWTRPFCWSELHENDSLMVSSNVAIGEEAHSYSSLLYCVTLKKKQRVKKDSTIPESISCNVYSVVVCAPMQIRNMLPYKFKYKVIDCDRMIYVQGEVAPTETAQLHQIDMSHKLTMSICLVDHPGLDSWSQDAIIYTNTIDKKGVVVQEVSDSITLTDPRLGSISLPLKYRMKKGTNDGPHIVFELTFMPNYVVLPSATSPALYCSKGEKTHVRIGASFWSKAVPVDATGTSGVVSITGDTVYDVYELAVSITRPPAPYDRFTKCITFAPRFTIVNKTPVELSYRVPDILVMVVKPTESLPVYCGLSKQIQIKFPGFHWSGFLEVDALEEYPVRLHSEEGNHIYIASVEITNNKAEITMAIWPDIGIGQFVIENHTRYSLTVAQAGAQRYAETIPSGCAVDFAWDAPSQQRLLSINHNVDSLADITALGKSAPIDLEATNSTPKHTISLNVIANGPTRVVQINEKHKLKKSDEPKKTELPEFSAVITLPQICISVVDGKPRELLYFSLEQVNIDYIASSQTVAFMLNIQNIQIDCQSHKALFPVLLAANSPKSGIPMLHFSTVRSLLNRTIDQYNVIDILLQEFDFQIEESTITRLIHMYEFISQTTTTPGSNTSAAATPTASQQSDKTRRVYIDTLMLQPIIFNASFSPTFTSDGDEDQPAGELQEATGLVHLAGVNLGKITRSPIHFPPLLCNNIFITWDLLMERCVKHYSDNAMRQVLVLAGSAETLGNTVSLFHNIKTGVRDFIFKPYEGFMISPKQFGAGIGKGSLSLARHSLTGLLSIAGSMTSRFGSEIASLSGDDKYIEEHQRLMSEQPTTLSEGLKKGGTGLRMGLFYGFTGVVSQPVRGAKDGPLGFIEGVYGGVVGAVAKPVSGVVDLAVCAVEGIRNTTSGEVIVAKRRRDPREISADKLVVKFSQHRAHGLAIWRACIDIDTHIYGQYVDHIESVVEGKGICTLLLTEMQLVYTLSETKTSTPKIIWTIFSSDILAVEQQKSTKNNKCAVKVRGTGGKPIVFHWAPHSWPSLVAWVDKNLHPGVAPTTAVSLPAHTPTPPPPSSLSMTASATSSPPTLLQIAKPHNL
ncbi:Vacuolar protein sorting-associated protein 13 [Pelomyxa schiedti]|nr:Vacuolar protein sorting-associated protein 13 [Pelomyxa schiedti]